MNRYKLIIEYEGTSFVGWQSQENGTSIQSSIEDSIKKLSSEKVTLFGAGRTDSGVHAKGQVAHFDLIKDLSIDKIRDGLNQHLKPLPIAILEVKKVDNSFHARFSAKNRFYKYLIINRRPPLTLYKNLAWNVYRNLNIDDMKRAASKFIGKHDLNAFRSINCQSSSSIKTINSCSVNIVDNSITIEVSAKSFLHSQVRIMVGTLVDIGKGKINFSEIEKIIKSCDRTRAGVTAPAHGLYLIKVEY